MIKQTIDLYPRPKIIENKYPQNSTTQYYGGHPVHHKPQQYISPKTLEEAIDEAFRLGFTPDVILKHKTIDNYFLKIKDMEDDPLKVTHVSLSPAFVRCSTIDFNSKHQEVVPRQEYVFRYTLEELKNNYTIHLTPKGSLV